MRQADPEPQEAGNSSDPIGSLLSNLGHAYAAAADGGSELEEELVLDGLRVRLRTVGAELRTTLLRALDPVLEPAQGPPGEATVSVWDDRSEPFDGAAAFASVPLAPGPERRMMVRISDSSVATFEEATGSITAVDRPRRRAFQVARGPDGVAWWELASPLRTALHGVIASPTRWLIHAGAVALPGGACALIVGRGGSGKSTLSLACLRAGMEYLGDDYVLVRTGPEPRVSLMYASAKVSAQSLELVPGFSDDVIASGTGERGLKHAIDMRLSYGAALRRRAPLAAVIAPRLSDRPGARTEPIRPARAVLSLAPSTTMQMPDRDGGALAISTAIANAVPSFALEVGPEPAAGAEVLAELLGGLA